MKGSHIFWISVFLLIAFWASFKFWNEWYDFIIMEWLILLFFSYAFLGLEDEHEKYLILHPFFWIIRSVKWINKKLDQLI